MHAYRKNDLKV